MCEPRYTLFHIKAVFSWVFQEYVNMYHGFINLFRLWFPDANWFWNYLPVVEEYVVSHQLIVLTICLLMTLIFFRNSILQFVNSCSPFVAIVIILVTVSVIGSVKAPIDYTLIAIQRVKSWLKRR